MPKRKEPVNIRPATEWNYTYKELLVHLRSQLDTRYGGVAKFLGTEDYLACGFEDNPKQEAKMYTYLSLPAEGEPVRTKSFPVLYKLYKGILGVEISSKIKVVRTQELHSSNELETIKS